jgi:hypothetical protein
MIGLSPTRPGSLKARPLVVVAPPRRPPLQPALARRVGEELDVRKPVGAREAVGAVADQQDVVGAIHHLQRDLGGIPDVPDPGHRAAQAARAVHHAAVQLDHPLFVGQAAVADGHVVRIVLDEAHPLDGGRHGAPTPSDRGAGLLHGAQPVGTGDGDGDLGGRSARAAEERGRGPRREEFAARDVHGPKGSQ